MKARIFGLALGLSTVCCFPALAESLNRVEGVPVGIGDTVAQVKSELHTDIEPEVMENGVPTAPNNRKTFIHLKTKGVWAFFNATGKVDTIRLEAPFSATVGGVKIGDPLTSVKAAHGEPIRQPFKFGALMSYVYVLNDVINLRLDINNRDEVETIFLLK